ncbi:LacI family DNA-binding transcriptional regulator [Jiangella anatolica]|uniref:LacI family transcriptional regulator n=1 Tax=Jiangella anatolica TaxID=2670374 RepID=A0A2W2C1M1_9ACTN|nr:LacI family DNA-binding transcriptional regulator [Jiangella anatolica]PZF86654.1 LacI family transcriptional regulator [Jiangella anatolica]
MTTQARTRAATINDVARVAGVSRAAVSKVLRDAYGVSDAMREKVNAAIDELGYRPRVSARGMRGATFTIGIELPNLDNPFFSDLVSGATSRLLGEPYQLIVAPASPANAEGERAIQALTDRQVDGVIAISPEVEQSWLEDVAAAVPLVMLGRHDDTREYDTVVGDDAAGTRLVLEHLLGLGHRRIAHLTLPESVTVERPNTTHGVREAAYRRIMADAGLAGEIRVVNVEPDPETVYAATRDLIDGPDRPTAVFAAHDELALTVLRAVADAGPAGGDVSVVGYDDTWIARHPLISLTSVNQSGQHMGGRAIDLLLDRVAGRKHPVHEVVAPRLLVRESSRAPTA